MPPPLPRLIIHVLLLLLHVSALQSCPAAQLQKEPFSPGSFAPTLACTSLVVATLTDPSYVLSLTFAAVSTEFQISQRNAVVNAEVAQSA